MSGVLHKLRVQSRVQAAVIYSLHTYGSSEDASTLNREVSIEEAAQLFSQLSRKGRVFMLKVLRELNAQQSSEQPTLSDWALSSVQDEATPAEEDTSNDDTPATIQRG